MHRYLIRPDKGTKVCFFNSFFFDRGVLRVRNTHVFLTPFSFWLFFACRNVRLVFGLHNDMFAKFRYGCNFFSVSLK